MKNRNSYIYALCLFLICLLINAAVMAEETVKIGEVLPMSGPVAYDGHSKHNGAIVATDEINAKGGVLGRKIELIVGNRKGANPLKTRTLFPPENCTTYCATWPSSHNML